MHDSTDRAVQASESLRPQMDTSGLAVRMRVDRLARILRDELSTVAARRGFSVYGDYQLVSTLRRSRQPMLPTELAAVMLLTRAGITGRLDRLEKAGFIERQSGEHDARTVRVSCTALGKRRADSTAADIAMYDRELLAPLDEQEIDELQNLLRKVLVSRDPDLAE